MRGDTVSGCRHRTAWEPVGNKVMTRTLTVVPEGEKFGQRQSQSSIEQGQLVPGR